MVDDEECARNFVVEYIENEDNGFKVVSSFGDAKSAFEYLEKNPTDLVLTDIKMPGQTGLWLAKEISESNIDTSVVIISGYDEFEYAKQAIEYNVFQYLLKPIDFFELDAILEKKRKLLDERAALRDLSDYSDMQRELFFSKLIFGGFTDSEEIRESYAEMDFAVAPENICIKIFCVRLSDTDKFFGEKWLYGKERFEYFVENLVCKTYRDTYVFSFKSRFDKFYFAIIGKKNALAAIDYGQLTDTVQSTFGFALRFGEVYSKEDITDITYPLADFGDEPVKEEKEMSNNEFISKAKKYVEKNYGKDIARGDIAEHLFISKSYVDKIFKQNLGMTFCEYLLDFRMKKAVELLGGNLKISDISGKVGYNNTRHFLRIFKSCYGCTPKEYRTNVLRRDEEQI